MPRWLTGFLAGVGVGILAGLVTMFLTGPGHGSDVPAVVMFPIMRVLVAYFDLPVVAVAGVGLLQYPLYGAVAGLLKTWPRGIAVVVAVHVIAAVHTLSVLGLMSQ